MGGGKRSSRKGERERKERRKNGRDRLSLGLSDNTRIGLKAVQSRSEGGEGGRRTTPSPAVPAWTSRLISPDGFDL